MGIGKLEPSRIKPEVIEGPVGHTVALWDRDKRVGTALRGSGKLPRTLQARAECRGDRTALNSRVHGCMGTQDMHMIRTDLPQGP